MAYRDACLLFSLSLSFTLIPDFVVRALHVPGDNGQNIVSTHPILPRANKGKLEWAIIGDSYSSGIAQSPATVFAEENPSLPCYRSNEAWGYQMNTNWESWQVDHSTPGWFSACAGDDMEQAFGHYLSLLQSHKRPSLVVGTFGINDIFFAELLMACIYHPVGYPSWGPSWHEDPEGTGKCKQTIAKAEAYLKDEGMTGFRAHYNSTLDKITLFARVYSRTEDSFDLFLGSYVRFFNTETVECDELSFASTYGQDRPLLVSGLRKALNGLIDTLNKIQADVILCYETPVLERPRQHVHYVSYDDAFEGHRFCEKPLSGEGNRTTWLANFSAENTTYDGIPIIMDAFPYAQPEPGKFPQLDPSTHGWKSQAFSPNRMGHEAMSQAFLGAILRSHVPGTSEPGGSGLSCNKPDIKYLGRGATVDTIENEYCPDAVAQGSLDKNSGAITRTYNVATMEEFTIRIMWDPRLGDMMPRYENCKRHLRDVLDHCPPSETNKRNWKFGGTNTVGSGERVVKYQIEPKSERRSWENDIVGGCEGTTHGKLTKFTVWGGGWSGSDWGDKLRNDLSPCSVFDDSFMFEYGIGGDGREWTAWFSTLPDQEDCIDNATMKSGVKVTCDG